MASASTTRTPEKERAVLEALREVGKVTSACRRAKVPRRTYYGWREEDAAFKTASDKARREGMDNLLDETEDALFVRAGKADTTAAIFLLKSHRRATYGDKQELSHTGQGGGPVVVRFVERADGPQ